MENQKHSLSVPIAIIIAGALIGFGIYWTGRDTGTKNSIDTSAIEDVSLDSIRPVDRNDHILGDSKSEIVIVEYSDTECPACKVFNATLHQILITYPGKIAWVFRHFPVHSKSVKEATALECAAELGGNAAFWDYTDRVFNATDSNDSLDLALLPKIASDIGLDANKFNTCLDSDKYIESIAKDKAEAMAARAEGTPYSVIFAKGQKIPITQGALPYTIMKSIIDGLLKI